MSKKILLSAASILLLVASFIVMKPAVAQDSGWLVSDDPQLLDQGVVETLPQTIAGYGNIDCQEHTFVTKKQTLTTQEASHTACAVRTNFGLVDPSGYIQLEGTKLAGKVVSSTGSTLNLLPIPQSNTVARLVYSGGAHKLLFIEGISHLTLEPETINGELHYQLPDNQRYLEDKAGNRLSVEPSSVSFSSNGQWMSAEYDSFAAYHVNLQTFSVIPYHAAYNYHNGASPVVHVAVDDTGRYVLVTNKNGSVRITDIHSCEPTPDNITGPVSCSTKDLQPFFGQQQDYSRVLQPRFVVVDKIVRLYVLSVAPDGTRSRHKYKMTPAGQTINKTDYVALGDSYTSGHGTWEYAQGTGLDGNGCRLSTYAYPDRISRRLELENYHNVACAGAKIDNITQYVQKTQDISPNPLGEWLPGSKKQLDYLSSTDTDIVTVSIGGNDILFSEKLKKCVLDVVDVTCYNSYEERKAIAQEINDIFGVLEKALTQIKDSLRTDAKVYAVGYPRIAKDNGNCAANVKLDSKEIRLSNQIINHLNGVIEAAAQKSGAYYVDVSNAFRGHKLCETTSDRVAVHGITAGRETPSQFFGPIAGESFHPKKLGHRLMSKKILRKTDFFQAPMPESDASAAPAPIADDIPLLRGYAPTGGSTEYAKADSLVTADTAVKGESVTVVLEGSRHALKPNSPVRVELHSDPIQLGEFTTDENGDVSQIVDIPLDLQHGIHTIHVYGENIAGESIDIYKTLFIAEDSNNYDGDMFTNHIDKCPIIDIIVSGESKNRRCHYRQKATQQ